MRNNAKIARNGRKVKPKKQSQHYEVEKLVQVSYN